MHEHKPERPAPSPWRIPVAVEDIAETGQHFTLTADEEVRSAVARIAGLRDLPRFEAEFEVTRQGAGGLRVVGRVSATVGQNCVVTLEPLSNAVEERVDLTFMPVSAESIADDAEAWEGLKERKWNDPEPLIGGVVNLGAVATEFLMLGIDPYPRKPGAVFEPPRHPTPEESPFAALAGWTRGRSES
jgi:hypothetical protein